MARKKIDHKTEYAVTRIGYCVGGDVEKAREMARRAGRLRSDIWNKFGSLQCWGISHQKLYKDFHKTNPPDKYKLDQKQWQKTFERVINEIQASQEAAKTAVIKKIYRTFKPEKDPRGKVVENTSFRKELSQSLNTLQWMDYPLLHRWMRSAYHRGHSWVNNQICVGIGNGAVVKRVSRNVISVKISGEQIRKRKYEKLTLLFKVGRTTPTGLFQIIFDDVIGEVKLHFPKIAQRKKAIGQGKSGLDKGFTEAFTDSKGVVYGDKIGQVMTDSVAKRHSRGRGRNQLYQIALKKNKEHIFKCNLGKKRHIKRENRKRATLNSMVRYGVNQFFEQYNHAITEDLSFVVKGKRLAKQVNRNLAEWCRGTLQKALEEISYRRQSLTTVVNAAYTSQVDHRYSVLLGTRNGDQFFTFDGEVFQADCNAARNIEVRATDPEISVYMKSVEVRKVLITRTVSFLLSRGLTLDDAIDRGWFNPRHLRHLKTSEKARVKSNPLVV
ncbi:MAG: transposase [Cyanobacteria bacterium P01_F01_bin.143]